MMVKLWNTTLKKVFQTLFTVCIILCTSSFIAFVISRSFSEQLRHDVNAFVYRSLHMSTDTSIYPSKKDNVLWYNTFKLRYLINNSDACKNLEPFLVIFVKTHPDHFDERETIRKTWGNVDSWGEIDNRHDVIVLFMLGQSKTHTRTLQATLEKENSIHHDIIQENFIEDFHNLTMKLISHLKWPVKFCQRAKYWMTTDDDVFVHVGNLVNHLKKQELTSYYSGFLHSGSPRNSDIKSKYYVPNSVYRGVYYPDYCPGAGYVLSLDVVKKLFDEAERTPMLYIDDAYAGILAHAAGVSPQHYVMFWGESRVSYDLCTLSKFITSHGHRGSEMVQFFSYIKSLSSIDPNYVCWGKLLSWVNPNDIVYF